MARTNKNEKLQDATVKYEGLRKLLAEMAERNHPYAEKMRERGVRPEHIRNDDDLSLLPCTTKKDLLDNYPTGWLAREKHEVVRIHATSGTTGKPTIVAYTANDIASWSKNVAWCLDLAGVGRDDVVQVAYGYGLFTGGLGLHYGAEAAGATVVPASGGFTDRQVALMKDLGTTVLACTPSYALRLAEAIEEQEERETSLRVGVFGAEAWSDGLRDALEARLGIKALDIYGLSEAMGPGVGMECLEQDGLHISDDFIPQVVDPDTLEPVAEGEEGELLLTSWTKEAYPVIRYRTRDLTRLSTAPCACGDPTPRIARIRGRSDDMLILNGVNVFPSQIEAAICKVSGLTPNYQITAWKENGVQKMSLACERTPESDAADIHEMEKSASKSLKQSVGVTIPFSILEPGAIPRSEGKAVRILKK